MKALIADRAVANEILLDKASNEARLIERFAYRLVREAEENSARAGEAGVILRLAKGLRRKLDEWRSHGE